MQIIKKKLREEMTTLKNSKILLVLLLIITVVTFAGCARYDGNPAARYDQNTTRYGNEGTMRGNYTTDNLNNHRVNDGVFDGTRNNYRTDNMTNRSNLNNQGGLMDGAINNRTR